jgi:hypothetical protein
MVEDRSRPDQAPPATVVESLATGSKELDECLGALATNLRVAYSHSNVVFRAETLQACEALSADSGRWARGELLPSGGRYNATLKALYESARSDVFCTSIPDYFPTWQTNLGQALLEAHGRSGAAVTRVFVFDTLAHVSADAVEVMRQHEAHARVRVLVFFDQEQHLVSFPPDLSRDSTMIDGGEVIGITMSFGQQPQAAWYFDDENMKHKLESFRKGLVESALPFRMFEERWTSEAERVAAAAPAVV